MPAAALPPLYWDAKQQVPPPLHGRLKLMLHSLKETRLQQLKLSPLHLRSYHRTLPAVKIRLLHLYLPLPPLLQHLLLLSPLLLCHPLQPPWFHRRHLRQKQIFSLLHPQPHPRPSRQLRFLHAAPSDRPRSTRRRLCLPCLYHPYCWETLRTVQRSPPILRGLPGKRRKFAAGHHSSISLYRPPCTELTPHPHSHLSARLHRYPSQPLRRDQRFAAPDTVSANIPRVTGANAV